jgi:retron-type reverse transcriptase
MPKTVDGLWEAVVSWDNLVAAYSEARKGKRYKPDVLRFSQQWEERLLNIHTHLLQGSWEPQPFAEFPIWEPKPRLIEAPRFADRVVHHALHRVVEPHFERRFIDHSYACRRGKGTHAATAAVQKLLRRCQGRWGRVYVLQADISKYFPSIRHDRFLQQVRRTIADEQVVALWERITRARGVDGVGLPIGALTSQLGANVYLDALDHHVTDDLGHGPYVRYMDDWLVMGPSKAALWRLLDYLRGWLWADLGLTLSKAHVYPASQGVDFAGYRTWATHRLPRKRTVKRARRRLKALAVAYRQGRVDRDKLRSVAASFCGYARHCDAEVTVERILEEARRAATA